MGQRHQIFIVGVKNPAMSGNGSRRKNMAKHFGQRATTVLHWHNQWLYGRSALQSCLNCLSIPGDMLTAPAAMTVRQQAEKWIDGITKAINTVPQNSEFRPDDTEGLRSRSLQFDEPDMMDHCDWGDNNDGIHIVDPAKGKYCFMFVNRREYYDGVPIPFVPVSAREYVRHYYSENPSTVNPYYVNDEKTCDDVAKEFAAKNEDQCKPFEAFTLFTIEDLVELFPLMAAQFQPTHAIAP